MKSACFAAPRGAAIVVTLNVCACARVRMLARARLFEGRGGGEEEEGGKKK